MGLEPNKILSSKYPVLATKSEKAEDNSSEKEVVRGLKQGAIKINHFWNMPLFPKVGSTVQLELAWC